MVKNVFYGLVGVVAVVALVAFVGYKTIGWERTVGMTLDTVPSQVYGVEAAGFNLRAYEFTSKSGKNCIFVVGENKGGLSCE